VSSAPAFYARSGGRWADWWTLLHPPYTLWHLSYVVIGAALAPAVEWVAFGCTLAAFLLAMGVAAHALDELQGRPLRTAIDDTTLRVTAVLSLVAAVGFGAFGLWYSGVWALLVLIPVGVFLVVVYNLELFSGRFHNDAVFALAWGGFPTLVGFLAQSPPGDPALAVAAAAAVAAAVALSHAQRMLSTPARRLRRRTEHVEGTQLLRDGTRIRLDSPTLLAPFEAALRALCWAVPLLALALLAPHLT